MVGLVNAIVFATCCAAVSNALNCTERLNIPLPGIPSKPGLNVTCPTTNSTGLCVSLQAAISNPVTNTLVKVTAAFCDEEATCFTYDTDSIKKVILDKYQSQLGAYASMVNLAVTKDLQTKCCYTANCNFPPYAEVVAATKTTTAAPTTPSIVMTSAAKQTQGNILVILLIVAVAITLASVEELFRVN